eukprot:134543-Prorocentrum_lima.AAC.1
MTSSLVGSEMCIRDRLERVEQLARENRQKQMAQNSLNLEKQQAATLKTCLLYTSDAADDM